MVSPTDEVVSLTHIDGTSRQKLKKVFSTPHMNIKVNLSQKLEQQHRLASEKMVSIQRLKRHNKQLLQDLNNERKKNYTTDQQPELLKKKRMQLNSIKSRLQNNINVENEKNRKLLEDIKNLEGKTAMLSNQQGLNSAKNQKMIEELKDVIDQLNFEIEEKNSYLIELKSSIKVFTIELNNFRLLFNSLDQKYNNLLTKKQNLLDFNEKLSIKKNLVKKNQNQIRKELKDYMLLYNSEKEKWQIELEELKETGNNAAKNIDKEKPVRERKRVQKKSNFTNLIELDNSTSKRNKMSELLNLLHTSTNMTLTKDFLSLEHFLRQIMANSDLNSGITNYINSLNNMQVDLESSILGLRKELAQFRTSAASADSLSGMKLAKNLETELERIESMTQLFSFENQQNEQFILMLTNSLEFLALTLGFNHIELITLQKTNQTELFPSLTASVVDVNEPRIIKKEKPKHYLLEVMSVVQSLLSQKLQQSRETIYEKIRLKPKRKTSMYDSTYSSIRKTSRKMEIMREVNTNPALTNIEKRIFGMDSEKKKSSLSKSSNNLTPLKIPSHDSPRSVTRNSPNRSSPNSLVGTPKSSQSSVRETDIYGNPRSTGPILKKSAFASSVSSLKRTTSSQSLRNLLTNVESTRDHKLNDVKSLF
ncbi:hypothetical protein PCE1_004838 [Barthelona sp. PCE]